MSALFDLAAGLARATFGSPEPLTDEFFTEDGDRVTVYEPVVVVEETALAPSGLRLPCGSTSFVRCDGDIFEAGVLTITSIDSGAEHRRYAPGQWVRATGYDRFGQIAYVHQGELR